MWDLVAGALLRAIQQSGELALFLVFLLEEAGVPLPLPGDLALVWAGFRVSTGQAQLFTVLLVVEAATAIGASSLYWLARRGGRPLILRYGRFLHLRESHLQRAEAFVERNATRAVFLTASRGDVSLRQGPIDASGIDTGIGSDAGLFAITAGMAMRCAVSGAACTTDDDCAPGDHCTAAGGNVTIADSLSAKGGAGTGSGCIVSSRRSMVMISRA